MRKPLSYIALTALVLASVKTTAVHADAIKYPIPSIENKIEQTIQKKTHPRFSWGIPGPISPILHHGSVQGAGMMEEPLKEIDSVMKSMMEQDVMPGAVTFVARSGHIAQHKAYGDAVRYKDDSGEEFQEPIAMKKDTIVDIASLSKIFTTIAAMKLYEDGKFQLDDPVAAYIPEFAQNGKDDVTIRQLMTHTSGLKPSLPLYKMEGTKEDRLQHVFAAALDDAPGTSYTYSDLNMITLGALIERISGVGLDEFVSENITEPLNMTDTMYNPPEKLNERIAATEYQPWTDRGLVWGEVHDENAWSLGGVAGHAGVFSTAIDLAKLGHMILNDGRYGSKQVLAPETIDLLTGNQLPSFPGTKHGLGWEIGEGWYMDALAGASAVGHTGYTGTSMVVNQDNNTIAILLTNRVHPTRDTVSTNPARRQFARKVADAIPVPLPDKQASWFSGYGDHLDRVLTAEVDVNNETTLSFATWYRMEQGYDIGTVEVSKDGENWTGTNTVFTGSSGNWQSTQVQIPAGTKFIRFTYQTDSYINGRGWYISDIKLDSGKTLGYTSDGWVKRND
ncbi:class A beta-lactamase-related serine hydrolase [Lentibacillus lipolyticus]|nr:class A beta-lactamase-related serine hydrolase [Lentibacillus lipolyticus]